MPIDPDDIEHCDICDNNVDVADYVDSAEMCERCCNEIADREHT